MVLIQPYPGIFARYFVYRGTIHQHGPRSPRSQSSRAACWPAGDRDRVRECPDLAASARASARPVGSTGMWAAASMQRLGLLLVVAGVARSQPLHDAAAEGDLDRVVVLLERPGIDVNQANKGTRPAQHCR